MASSGVPSSEVATLAGGCFWCLEAVFEQLRGVQRVESGYAGGSAADPEAKPSLLLGISLPPKRSLTIPASSEVVHRLKFKQGISVRAADLNGF